MRRGLLTERCSRIPSLAVAFTLLSFACDSAPGRQQASGAEAPPQHSSPQEPSPPSERALPPTAEGTGGGGNERTPSLAPLIQAVRPTVVGVTTRATLQQVNQLPPGTFEDFWKDFFGGGNPFGGMPEGPGGGQPGVRMGVGSGVIVDPQGLVLTNNHVVEGADEVLIRTSTEKEYEAEVIGRDPETDLALLRLRNVEEPLPAARLGDSDALRVGDYVVAIGDPFGLDFTVTSGIISAKARIIGAGPFDDFLQTDAAINPGNSGGPLFDLDGNVVGINTAIVAGGQGIGFAVPIDLVKVLLPQLIERGQVTRGYLGVGIQDLTPELARALGVEARQGALIASVEEKSPAARAGLRVGDVVVSLEGEPVESAAQLSRSVAMLQPGRRTTLEVLRDGRRREVTVELGQRPVQEAPGQPERREAGRLGIALQPVPAEVQRQLGIQGGAQVAAVQPGSSAARAGLAPGDVIIEANRRPVQGPQDVVAQAKEARGEPLLLRVLSQEGARYVVIQPPTRQE